jgi:hypothetical protein
VSWFFKAGLGGLAAACLIVLATVTAFAKYPYDNGHHYGQLSNPGHHYGQLKHHPSPPPAPPSPSPNPGPTTHPSNGGSTPAVTGHKAGAGATNASTASGISGLPVTVPSVGGQSEQVSFTQPAAPAGDLQWWLLLLVPALAALWVISGARTAQRASQRWRGAKPPA